MRESRRELTHIIAAALLLTLLNAVKPLHADDPAFYAFAVHLAAHPLDPYGFAPGGQPALHVLLPPVLSYWLALGIALFGEAPIVAKLWLFPFCLLLVTALAALLRRCARGFEPPLLWMTMISPSILPSINLMLDVPALALTLTAVVVFGRALDRNSRLLVVAAGVVAGLAMQTKYTALVAPAVILLYAWIHRRTAAGLIAAVVAVSTFALWEALIRFGYGESSFLYHLPLVDTAPHLRMLRLVLPLVAMLGGVSPGTAFLAISVLGGSRRTIRVAVAGFAVAFAALALVPDHYAVFLQDPSSGRTRLTLNNLVFGTLGLSVCAISAAVVHRLYRHVNDQARWIDRVRAHPVEWFVMLWFGLELIAYFVISPFPAMRRLLGMGAVGSLVVGCLATRCGGHWTRLPFAREVLAVSLTIGGFFYAVDLLDALSEKQAVERAIFAIGDRVQPFQPTTVWFAGCCGFRFHAERAGMRPLIPSSEVRKGDWLLVPDRRLQDRTVCITGNAVDTVATTQIVDALPLTMMPTYYVGRTPMLHLDGPRRTAAMYRATMDFVACVPP